MMIARGIFPSWIHYLAWMIRQKLLATIFLLIGAIFTVVFYMEIEYPKGLEAYFHRNYYRQFGSMAISLELLIAGYYLLVRHLRTNFAMALFGFTVMLDLLYTLIGLFSSGMHLYATITFLCAGGIALFLAFTNSYNLGRISWMNALGSFVLGNAVELFFNYF